MLKLCKCCLVWFCCSCLEVFLRESPSPHSLKWFSFGKRWEVMSEVLSVSCQSPEQKLDKVLYCSLWEEFYAHLGLIWTLGPLGSRTVTFFIFFAMLYLSITKWRLCLCHGILSYYSFRPGHRQSWICSVDICNGSTIACVLLYLHKEPTASQGQRTSGGDSAVPACCAKQIRAQMCIQQDFPLIVFLSQEPWRHSNTWRLNLAPLI